MKNKKGEVATLLTLGLVLIGTLITIGTSLFVSNKKTNLASNPRAAETCTTGFYALKGDPLVSGSGCAPVCGSDCEECNWNGETKWQCKTATTGGSGVPACTKARTYASLTNCKAEHPGSDGDANCKQCLLGQTNRVEYGGSGPPAGGSEEKTGKLNGKCKAEQEGGIMNYYCDPPLVCSDSKKGGTCIESKEKTATSCTSKGKDYSCDPNLGPNIDSCTPKQFVGIGLCGDNSKVCCKKAYVPPAGGGKDGSENGCFLYYPNFDCSTGGSKIDVYRSNSEECTNVIPDNKGANESCWGTDIKNCASTFASATTAGCTGVTPAEAPPAVEGGDGLPIVNNSDDQVCIDRFKTEYTYCGRSSCTRQDNMGTKVLEYEYSDFSCGSDITRTYNCCVRSDVDKDPNYASDNKSLPKAIPESNHTRDDKKCTDAYETKYAYCGSIYGCFAPQAIIEGKPYKYETQEYFCNLNSGIDAKCCVAGPKINTPMIISDTTSAQTPATTSDGEQGNLVDLPGGTAFTGNQL